MTKSKKMKISKNPKSPNNTGHDKGNNNRNKAKSKNYLNLGKWSVKEHRAFIIGILLYGNFWEEIQKVIKTRSVAQCLSHAQKFFLKLGKKKILPSEIFSSKKLREYSRNMTREAIIKLIQKLTEIYFKKHELIYINFNIDANEFNKIKNNYYCLNKNQPHDNTDIDQYNNRTPYENNDENINKIQLNFDLKLTSSKSADNINNKENNNENISFTLNNKINDEYLKKILLINETNESVHIFTELQDLEAYRETITNLNKNNFSKIEKDEYSTYSYKENSLSHDINIKINNCNNSMNSHDPNVSSRQQSIKFENKHQFNLFEKFVNFCEKGLFEKESCICPNYFDSNSEKINFFINETSSCSNQSFKTIYSDELTNLKENLDITPIISFDKQTYEIINGKELRLKNHSTNMSTYDGEVNYTLSNNNQGSFKSISTDIKSNLDSTHMNSCNFRSFKDNIELEKVNDKYNNVYNQLENKNNYYNYAICKADINDFENISNNISYTHDPEKDLINKNFIVKPGNPEAINEYIEFQNFAQGMLEFSNDVSEYLCFDE